MTKRATDAASNTTEQRVARINKQYRTRKEWDGCAGVIAGPAIWVVEQPPTRLCSSVRQLKILCVRASVPVKHAR
jgi:hypothetical protein